MNIVASIILSSEVRNGSPGKAFRFSRIPGKSILLKTIDVLVHSGIPWLHRKQPHRFSEGEGHR